MEFNTEKLTQEEAFKRLSEAKRDIFRATNVLLNGNNLDSSGLSEEQMDIISKQAFAIKEAQYEISRALEQ